MAVVKLKKIKLDGPGPNGMWPSNTPASVCFCVVPIGSALTVPSPGHWNDYPPNTQLTFFADGFLSLYINGKYKGADLSPAVQDNLARTDAQVDIFTEFGVARVKFDVIPT